MKAEIDKKDIKQIDKKVHIYDFLTQVNLPHDLHDILVHKYQSKGLKTHNEWELITEIKIK